MTGTLRIGTCGWSYDHWTGPFYPEGLPAAERLEFYASQFDTVEIDATFYRLPSERAVATWRDAVPPGFRFAVKGSRYITHFRRLSGIDDSLREFMARSAGLGDKLAVVLWQLPPTLALDPALLDSFLALLPSGPPRHAVEFRHQSWLAREAFEVLTRRGAACVNVSGDMMPDDFTATADFVYARFHGLARTGGAYDAASLEPWARFIAHAAERGKDCFAYFNNDAGAHAPADAVRLKAVLGIPAEE